MPNRVLRDWTNSERFDELSSDAEIFFTRLIMKADDFGGFYGNTKLLKSHLYPLKDFAHSKIEPWIRECANIGIISYYEVEGIRYVRINDFGQRTRIMKSKFPECPTNDGHMTDMCLTIDGVKPNQTETETKPKPKPKEKCRDILFTSINDETSLSENESIAFSFWTLFKENLKATGITSTTTLDKASIEKWTNDVRLMISSDKRTVDEIRCVWYFLGSNEFWKKNIQSTSKLREQFERLYQEAKTIKPKDQKERARQEWGADLYERLKQTWAR